MSITKAFLYTILVFILWVFIQLTILVPVKYFGGKAEDLTHLFGITKIVSTVGAYLIIYFFFWKPKLNLKKIINSKNYNLRIFFYLTVLPIGLIFINRPFWDFTKIIAFYQKGEIYTHSITPQFDSQFIYVCVSSLIIAPLVEELFFRKFLLQKLSERNNSIISLFVSSFCFSLIHLETPNNLIPAFISGLVFGIIYLKTNRIEYTIAAHFIVNVIILSSNSVQISLDILFFGYNFNVSYWILFLTGIIFTLMALKQIINTTSNLNKEN